MKTKNLLLTTVTILTVFITTLNAQEYEYVPFPTENAIWSTFETWPSAPQPADKMNIIYALFNEDTIIGNKVCQKLFKVYDTISSRESAYLRYLLYEDNKRVFINDLLFKRDSILLYDFNLQIGDTVVTDLDIQTFLIVSQIDTLLIGNKKRKRIKFTMSESCLDNMYWIEGIGSTNGLLHPGDFVVGTHNTLLCFKENSETIYYNNIFGTCYPDYPTSYNSINDKKEVKRLNIYPNPATEKISIELTENAIGTLKIYSLEGRIILNENITINYKHDVSISHFKEGVYIVQFANNKTNSVYRNYLIINQ